ncbi:hypothetical protein POL68_25270 [Stigmatella sp. ncwal1]|uniref:Uncharacterized protein n=1 Tax=Stigmatella ashevillensis TaxID=2995309 RepID=A0ABT5DDP6_9BACT|nr:hypothetical protein [Stigmatella ashevillena]MDC0711805.1 hypothetical protein [Stigmatella ashevillena]
MRIQTRIQTLAWSFSAGLALFTAPALAEDRRREPSSCQERCDDESQRCRDICQKYAGGGSDECFKSCEKEQKQCTRQCKDAPQRK